MTHSWNNHASPRWTTVSPSSNSICHLVVWHQAVAALIVYYITPAAFAPHHSWEVCIICLARKTRKHKFHSLTFNWYLAFPCIAAKDLQPLEKINPVAPKCLAWKRSGLSRKCPITDMKIHKCENSNHMLHLILTDELKDLSLYSKYIQEAANFIKVSDSVKPKWQIHTRVVCEQTDAVLCVFLLNCPWRHQDEQSCMCIYWAVLGHNLTKTNRKQEPTCFENELENSY